MFRYLAASRIRLVLILLLSTAPAAGQVLQNSLAQFGDWTVYELRDGEIQVCYVETPLVHSREAEWPNRDLMLQVSNRSFSGGPMIRFSNGLPDELELTTVIADVRRSVYAPGIEYPTGADDEDIERLKAIEAEVAPVFLADTSLFFSMNGFADAYDTMTRYCEEPPNVEGQKSTPATPMIAVSDVTVSIGDSLQFSVTGPFFRPGEFDALRIRAIPRRASTWTEDYVVVYLPDRPDLLLEHVADTLEFYRDDTPVDTIVDNDSVLGIETCLDPYSQRLKLLTHRWSGAASDPGTSWVMSYSDDGTIDREIVKRRDIPDNFASCSGDQASWMWGSQFEPCRCGGRLIETTYNDTVDSVVDEIKSMGDDPANLQHYEDARLSNLVERIGAIGQFVKWDWNVDFGIERFGSDRFEIVAIEYVDELFPENSVQLILARPLDRDLWTRLYRNAASPKSRQFAYVHGFVDNKTLDLNVCQEDCDWWGRHERVHWDLDQRLGGSTAE